MSDDMLICFDSPAGEKGHSKSNRTGLSSPLIPCPSTPFDLVYSRPGDDPFDPPYQEIQHRARFDVKSKTPDRYTLAPPVADATTPSPMLIRRAMSDADISGVVPGQYLVSSTPLVSNSNTPTRSSRTVHRRSILSTDNSISCALIQSKLEFINKVNMNIAVSEKPGLSRSKSISNLQEAFDTSVQHRIFGSSKLVIAREQNETLRRRRNNCSLPVNSPKANCSSFITDQDEAATLETSAYRSYLMSPQHTLGNANPTPEDLRLNAQKVEILFSLCLKDDYNPQKNVGDDCEWIRDARFPDAWFDDSFDFEHIHRDSDSDEEKASKTRRFSTKDEMEAIKERLDRLRKSQPVKEFNGKGLVDGSVPVSPSQIHVETEAPPAAAPPAAPPLVVVPKMPLAPGKKAPNPAPVKKGPLKAVEPVPKMIKKSLSSDLLIKNKPAVTRGRPTSAQGPHRQPASSSRRSNSISPNRSGNTLPSKNSRPLVASAGNKARAAPVTGKGKENRV